MWYLLTCMKHDVYLWYYIRKLNHFTESFNLIWFAIHEFKMIHRLFLDLQLWEIGLWAMLCHIYTLRFSPLWELLLSVLLLSTLWQAFLVVPDVCLVDQSALLSLFLNWQLSFFCLHLKLQYPVFEKLKAMTIKVHWLLLEYNKPCRNAVFSVVLPLLKIHKKYSTMVWEKLIWVEAYYRLNTASPFVIKMNFQVSWSIICVKTC